MPIVIDGTTGILLTGNAGLVQTGNGQFTFADIIDVDSGGTGVNTLTGVVKASGNTAFTAGKVSLDTEVSGTLNVSSGGTGLSTITANTLLVGNGTSAIVPLTTGTAGQILKLVGSPAAPAWGDAPSGSEIVRVARTTNIEIGNANRGNLIDITSGTFTQTFAAAATLTSGWFCYIRNSGTGDITLDPNGSETIDSLTSFVMYPNEVRLIQSDGSSLRSIVLNAFYRVFTGSGTFTKPPGYSGFQGLIWSGGAGGCRSDRTNTGGGGGCVPFLFANSALSTSESVTIGAGGTGATVAGDAGTDGGNSVFGGITVLGGKGNGQGGGLYVVSEDTWDAGEAFAGAERNSGRPGRGSYGGGAGGYATTATNTLGGNSVYGGGGGGGGTDGVTRAGGTSVFGGAGGQGGPSPTEGSIPGGGGGSGYGTSGRAGARGEMRIWGVI